MAGGGCVGATGVVEGGGTITVVVDGAAAGACPLEIATRRQMQARIVLMRNIF